MPLVQASLSSALQVVFASLPVSAAASADQLANAYAVYAATGMFGSSAPTLTPAHKAALAGTLLGAIAVPASGSPASLAGAWAAGIATFWTAVPVAGAQSGATVGCPGAAALTATLSAVFGNLGNTAASCAAALAAALHTATLTVTATVAPPPGTVLTLL